MAPIERLCTQCLKIFSGESYTQVHRYPDEIEGIPTDGKNEFPHHDNFASFVSAVNTSCPICFRVSMIHSDEFRENSSEFYTRYHLQDNNQDNQLTLRILSPNDKLTRFTFNGAFSRPRYPERLRISQKLRMRYEIEKSEEAKRYREDVSKWFEDTTPRVNRKDCEECGNVTSVIFHPNTCSPRMHRATRFWLQLCESSHTKCKFIRPTIPTAPTRLIDIGNADTKHWRLHICANELSDCPRYVTLSHRWGNSKFLNLTSSNMKIFCSGLPVDDLPRTFRDAVYVAKAIDVRYIWIDSLCIIQDSEKDWEQESVRMSHVYQNSFCNIVAAYSDGPDGGLFSDRDSARFQPFHLHTSWTHEKAPNAHFEGHESDSAVDDLKNIPLFERGWVFQERLLSPRLLIFTRNQTYWRCRSLVASEAALFGGLDERAKEGESPVSDIFWGLESLTTGENAYKTIFGSRGEGFADLWCEILTPFLKCKLTYPTDRLAALGGISQFMHEKTGDRYLAGLWRNGLPQMLCWRVKGRGPYERQPKVAPSWSWASISDHDAIDFQIWKTGLFIDMRALVTVSESESEMQSGESRRSTEIPTVTQLDGELIEATLRCPHGTKHITNKAVVEVNSHRGEGEMGLNSEEEIFNALRFDAGSTVYGTCINMYLLPLIIHNDFAEEEPIGKTRLRVYGLILERHKESVEEIYRRIGCFRFSDSHVALVGIALERNPAGGEPKSGDEFPPHFLFSVSGEEDRSNKWWVLHDRPIKRLVKLV